ncbi:MAG: ferric reductase-like transmembrane domain-containing protein [Bacteroidales bacterium]|nr:ferric reductase-like transmembrane domain-containing protein [Bacteroidales bacterium]
MKWNNIILVFSVLIGLPLLFWAVGDFPRRTILKEVLSVLTLIAFTMMIGQFYLTRNKRKMFKVKSIKKLIKLHKIIGYVFIGIILLHPFFIVFPRYFESGVEPMEAFTTLITTYNSSGVVLGLIAYLLILIIGITSIFRNKLPMKYTSWRLLHGVLSIIFIIVASCHAIDLGRHTDVPMSIFIIILSGSGVILLLKTYFSKPQNNRIKP